jgi:hypothetical protein
MAKLKRYSLDTSYIANGMSIAVGVPCKTGEWVKFASVQRLLKPLNKRVIKVFNKGAYT